MCQIPSDYEPGTILHTLYIFHMTNAIIWYIKENLTYQGDIMPVNVIITNTRCIKQVDNRGKATTGKIFPHPRCSIYNDNLDKCKALPDLVPDYKILNGL